MKLTIFGTRGSIPAPSGKTAAGRFCTEEFGGNTTCFLIETANNKKHIIDAGTGIKNLGSYLQQQELDANLYFTHTHWDHIQGFPFFTPAYASSSKINVYGEIKEEKEQLSGIKDVLTNQQTFRNFPAPLQFMKGIANFYDFLPGEKVYEDEILTVETMGVNHPGGCISYKFKEKESGKTIVVTTDFEPDHNGHDQKLIDWWQGADLVLADGQYEVDSKINPFISGWGHSDYITNVDLAHRAEVGKLLIVHHDPKMDDAYHLGLEERAKQYANQDIHFGNTNLEVALAREGQSYEVCRELATV